MEKLISVLVPAAAEEGLVRAAVLSILRGGVPEEALDVVVEIDDGRDHFPLRDLSPAVRVFDAGERFSGPGAARNRAIARCLGRWITYVDADDAIEPGYLAEGLAICRDEGAAAGRLRVLRGEAVIFDQGDWGETLDFELAARTGASIRPFVTRAMMGRFLSEPSQDIFHGLECLGLSGGRLRLTRAAYLLHLRSGSVTDAAGFAERLDGAYRRHEARFLRGESRLRGEGAAAAARVFAQKAELNRRHREEGCDSHFYAFAARQARSAEGAGPAPERPPGKEAS